MVQRKAVSVASVVLLLVGCIEKDEGPPETGSTTETQGESTDTEDTDTSTDTDMPLPAECLAPDPDVKAEFLLTVSGWPDEPIDQVTIDVMCTIDALVVEPDGIEHALTCDDEGTPRSVTLRVPPPTGGSVTWSEGDAVRLFAARIEDEEFGLDRDYVRMLAADTTPLLFGQFGRSENGPSLSPIVYTDEFPCGPEGDGFGPARPFAVRFELGAESVTIVHGHRGVLPIEGTTEVFAIDLAEATAGHCCQFTRRYDVLVQRISPS